MAVSRLNEDVYCGGERGTRASSGHFLVLWPLRCVYFGRQGTECARLPEMRRAQPKRESPHPSAIVVRPVLHWSAPLLSAPLAAFVRKAVTGRMGAGQMTAPSKQTPLLGSEPQVTTPGAHVSTCCSGGRTVCWICPRVRTSARRRNGVDVIASPLRPRRLQGGGRVPTHADLLPVGFRLRGFRNLTDSLLV